MSVQKHDERPNHNIVGYLAWHYLYLYMEQYLAKSRNLNFVSIAARLWERLDCQMDCAVECSAASHHMSVIFHIHVYMYTHPAC